MPATLTSTLEAAIAARTRRPAVSATVRRRRFGMHLLEWQRAWNDDTDDQPHAVVSNSDGEVLVFRNAAGTLYANRITDVPLARNSAGLGDWTSLAITMTSGKQFAAVAHPTNDEVLVVFANGNDLKYVQSTDGGATWGSATTIVTEASAIGAVGAAVRTSSGNVCVFYQVGTATLKRIRRTSGSWAGSGTTASPTFATITGIAACHNGADFAVVVTGTQTTTTIPGVWSYYMGDGNLPSNVWSTAVAVVEADTDSGISYHHPAIIPFTGSVGFYLAFGQTATEDVAGSRAYFATTVAPNTTSTEPAPLGETTAYGLSLAVNAAGDRAYAASSRYLAFADFGDTLDVSTAVSALRVRFTARSARATVTLSDPTASRVPLVAGSEPPLPAPLLSPGHELLLSCGYTTSVGAEYGTTWTLVLDAVRVHFDRDGIRHVILECSGVWEQLARWRVPQAWQTASAVYTRSELATRIAARAGIPLSQMSNPRQPSYVWRTHEPAFALVAGETGAAAMARLLDPTPDILRGDASGGGVIRSVEDPRWAALVRRMEPLYWWRLDREAD